MFILLSLRPIGLIRHLIGLRGRLRPRELQMALVRHKSRGADAASIPLGRACRFALADSSLCLIDHEGRHLIEEFPKDLFGFTWQRSFPQSIVHQPHPPVAGSLIDGKRRMPRAEARMASLFDVSLGPTEPTDQEISEALLGTWRSLAGYMGPRRSSRGTCR
jgi:hypothetical protein